MNNIYKQQHGSFKKKLLRAKPPHTSDGAHAPRRAHGPPQRAGTPAEAKHAATPHHPSTASRSTPSPLLTSAHALTPVPSSLAGDDALTLAGIIRSLFADDGWPPLTATAYAMRVNQRVFRQRSFSQSFSIWLLVYGVVVTSNSTIETKVVVAVSEEASARGGLLGGLPLMPASQAESGDERAAPIRMDGPVRAGRRRSATASPTFACSQQVPPAGAGGERCLPRCPRGPRRMGWPSRLGTDEAGATWALPTRCNSYGPRVTAIFDQAIRLAPLALWSTRSSRSLSLSCSPPPTDEVSHLQCS